MPSLNGDWRRVVGKLCDATVGLTKVLLNLSRASDMCCWQEW